MPAPIRLTVLYKEQVIRHPLVVSVWRLHGAEDRTTHRLFWIFGLDRSDTTVRLHRTVGMGRDPRYGCLTPKGETVPGSAIVGVGSWKWNPPPQVYCRGRHSWVASACRGTAARNPVGKAFQSGTVRPMSWVPIQNVGR